MIRRWASTLWWLATASTKAPAEPTYGQRFTDYTVTPPSPTEN